MTPENAQQELQKRIKQSGMPMIIGGVITCALVAVLQYTLWEFYIAWLLLAAGGVAGIALGLNRLVSSVFVAIGGSVALAAAGFGVGVLINHGIKDVFSWVVK